MPVGSGRFGAFSNACMLANHADGQNQAPLELRLPNMTNGVGFSPSDFGLRLAHPHVRPTDTGDTQERQDLADTQPASDKEIQANLAKSKDRKSKTAAKSKAKGKDKPKSKKAKAGSKVKKGHTKKGSKASQKKTKKRSTEKPGKKVTPKHVARDLGKELAAAAAHAEAGQAPRQQSEPKGNQTTQANEQAALSFADTVKPCTTKELEDLIEEDGRLAKLYELPQEQLAQRVQSCKAHPWFNQWVLEVLEPKTAAEWEAVRKFGNVPQVVCEEVWEFENWVLAKEKAGDPKFPEPEPSSAKENPCDPKLPEPELSTNQKENGDTEQQTTQAEAIESNLLRPATCDLASPPATPVAAPQHVVPEDLPPGEAAAEEEKKLKEEQKKRGTRSG